MKQYTHINQHNLRKNIKLPPEERLPVVTSKTYKENNYFNNAELVCKDTGRFVEDGGKFVLFEEVLSKGVSNSVITDWMKKYKHVTLGDESTGCNYQRKEGITLEVCIYN